MYHTLACVSSATPAGVGAERERRDADAALPGVSAGGETSAAWNNGLLAPYKRLRWLNDDERVLQRCASQASQRREDTLDLMVARPTLGKFDQHDTGVWRWKLASVTFEVVILCDERCACCSRLGEDIGVGTCPQPNAVSMFAAVAFGL